MKIVAYHLRCIGRVQGVFYRASTKEQAQRLGVKGWVKNESNGDVTVHAEGEEKTVMALYEWCQNGPPLAIVKEVVRKEAEIGHFKTFDVRYI